MCGCVGVGVGVGVDVGVGVRVGVGVDEYCLVLRRGIFNANLIFTHIQKKLTAREMIANLSLDSLNFFLFSFF